MRDVVAVNQGATRALRPRAEDALGWDKGHWRSCAPCRDEDPELFFPISSTGQALAQTTEAKKVCVRCVVYPPASREIGSRRRELAPAIHEVFDAFSQQVFADGALPAKTKQLTAVAAAHVTQCPFCIRGHAKLAHRAGASDEEIMEASWVAAEMRAGGAFALPRWRCTRLPKSSPRYRD